MELRVHPVLLGFPAVTELERTHGAERQNMAILVISRLCTSQRRTTNARPRAGTGLGVTPPPTPVVGDFVSWQCPSPEVTRLLVPCATSLALTGANSTSSASKRGRTGLGAIQTRSRRNGATALLKWRVVRAKRATLASLAAPEATTRSRGAGLTIKAPSGDSAYSMLFTEARGSSHVPATIINEALFRLNFHGSILFGFC